MDTPDAMTAALPISSRGMFALRSPPLPPPTAGWGRLRPAQPPAGRSQLAPDLWKFPGGFGLGLGDLGALLCA